MTAWSQVEAALNGILDRRWYTNHGPLARLLEAEWAEASGRNHAIAVVNPTIGLIMMAESLALSGEVLLSALAPPRCAQALRWAGLQPRFCDIDPFTLGLDPQAAAGGGAAAVLITPGGNAAAIASLAPASLTEGRNDWAGATLVDLPGIGDEAGACCILTDDDHLAARLRNIRSSYGAGTPAPVIRTANGRLSEAQAAMALCAPAGWSFQSLAFAASAPVLDGFRTLAFGRDILVLADTAANRPELARALRPAFLDVRPLLLEPDAARCVEAASVAARALVVRPTERSA